MFNMVEDNKNTKLTRGSSGATDPATRIEMLELKCEINSIREEDKVFYVLRELGDDVLLWYIGLPEKIMDWNIFKKALKDEWESKLAEAEEKKRIQKLEEEITRKVSMEVESRMRAVEEANRSKISEKRKSRSWNHRQDNNINLRIKCYRCSGFGHIERECGTKKFDYQKDGISGDEVNKGLNRYMENKVNRISTKVKKFSKRYKLTLEDYISDFPFIATNDAERNKIKFCPVEKCSIETIEGKTVCKRGAVIPQGLHIEARKYIDSLLERGIIRRSTSQWRNPIRVISKENGGVRIVSNLMALNDLTIKDNYKIPEMRRITESIAGAEFITVLDLKEGYYQIEIKEEHKHKTAFEFQSNVYEWNGMVMGFKNAPMIFQRIMDRIFGELIGNGIFVYMDDLIIYAENLKEHDRIVRKVFSLLSKNNLKINVKKVQFGREKVNVLGITLSGKERMPLEFKKNEALFYPRPNSVAEIRRFLGLAGWFRDFIPRYAEISKDLYECLKGKSKFEWNEKEETSFLMIKRALKEAGNLKLPEFDKNFVLKTDASNTGLGAVLLQADSNGKYVPIRWASKKLTATEQRYTISEKEMLAVVWGIEKFEYELKARKFHCITDHKALEHIRTKPEFNNNRINRWVEKIQEYDFTVEYRKGIELVDADALSRLYENDSKNKINKQLLDSEKSKQIKKGVWTKHVIEQNGKNFWRFDNGLIRKIPDEEERRNLIIACHTKLMHRGLEPTYYELKREFYWPRMKNDISTELNKCETCNINNRKRMGGCDFVTTNRCYEKVAIDIMHLHKEDKYILIMIDYFSRVARIRKLENRTSRKVIKCLEDLLLEYGLPEKLISDNAKEFVSAEFKEWCLKNKIEHHLVTVESHRSNGRIERVIRTIRESMVKSNIDLLDEKIFAVEKAYNNAYHSGIKCTPLEAWSDIDGIAGIENSVNGKYKNRFKSWKRGKFNKDQEVRIAKRENLTGKSKDERGRFLKRGLILEKFPNDSYLVRDENGKVTKKRHYDLKGINIKMNETLSREGDVVSGNIIYPI